MSVGAAKYKTPSGGEESKRDSSTTQADVPPERDGRKNVGQIRSERQISGCAVCRQEKAPASEGGRYKTGLPSASILWTSPILSWRMPASTLLMSPTMIQTRWLGWIYFLAIWLAESGVTARTFWVKLL